MSVPSDTLDIEQVIKQTFRTVGRNLLPFGVMALVLVSLPNFMFAWSQAQQPDLDPRALLSRTYPLVLVEIAFTVILQACIIYGSVMDLKGRQPTFSDILSGGARRAVPVFLVSLAIVAALALGMGVLWIPILAAIAKTRNSQYLWLMVLAVPVIVAVACAWAVAIPASVSEEVGVFGAFRRSRELTRGSRWRILGTYLLFVLLLVALRLAIYFGIMIFAPGGAGLAGMSHAPAAIVASAVLSGLSGLLGAVLIAVVYEELRRIKEGRSVGRDFRARFG